MWELGNFQVKVDGAAFERGSCSAKVLRRFLVLRISGQLFGARSWKSSVKVQHKSAGLFSEVSKRQLVGRGGGDRMSPMSRMSHEDVHCTRQCGNSGRLVRRK